MKVWCNIQVIIYQFQHVLLYITHRAQSYIHTFLKRLYNLKFIGIIIEGVLAILNFVNMAGNLYRFFTGFLKSLNSVGNINKAESLQKNRKQFASRRKGLFQLRAGSCLNSTSIRIHLLSV